MEYECNYCGKKYNGTEFPNVIVQKEIKNKNPIDFVVIIHRFCSMDCCSKYRRNE